MAYLCDQHSQVIVFGNEKGGTGKSTTAMHVVIGLLASGAKIAVIDLDRRQQTLTRYLENRSSYARKHSLDLRCPEIHTLPVSNLPDGTERELQEAGFLTSLVDRLDPLHDVIVIDCPGSDTPLARLAYALATTLITPLNDSFVDLDIIAQVDADTYEVGKLSLYSETVWESRKQRALAGKRGLDWIIMRNRIGTTDSKNKRRVDEVLKKLRGRIAFRYVPGLSERVIYRELFPKGLTLVDLIAVGAKLSMSHVAARQELRTLIRNLRLPEEMAGTQSSPA
ncbi:MAG: division plane positioning ATPase MipZ [Gammaproteobacteria bacterium]